MKRLTKSLLKRAGYQLVPLPTSTISEAFFVQRSLMSGNDQINIFDVGAFDGETALTYRALFPDAEIFSFEPFGESFSKLLQTVQSDKRIHAVNCAVSNIDGQCEFNANKYAGTNSLLKTDEQGDVTWGIGLMDTLEKIRVQSTTLDKFVEQHNLDCIDILKMDVQGAEPLVLQGARKSIKSGKVKLVFSEIITMPTYVNQKHLDEFLLQMRDLEFELFNFYNPSLTPDKRLRCLDALFVHASFDKAAAA